jgi:hypothetical protein
MSTPKKTKKQNSYRKRFFRKNNPLLREANRIIECLFGTNEEKLGNFLMLEQSSYFKEKYPDELKRKDIAYLVKAQLRGKTV